MKKKYRNRFIIIVGLLFVLMIAITARSNKKEKTEDIEFARVSVGKFDVTVSTTGTLEAENYTEIKGPEIPNSRYIRVQSLTISDMVTEGTIVKKGDYVAQLDKSTFENSVKGYEETLQNQILSYEQLLLDSAVTLSRARNNILNQRYVVESAVTKLSNSRFESAGTIRQAELSLSEQQSSLDQLERSYELSLARINANINRSQNRIKETEEQIAEYRMMLDKFTITAPADGMVVYAKTFQRSKIQSGSSINMMQNIVATLPDLSSMLTKSYVSEVEVNMIKVGQTVNITVDAFPSKSFTGTIISVSKMGETLANSETKVFEVYIRLDKVDSQMRPDMTTSNIINIANYNNVLYVPNESIYTINDSTTVVYTKNGHCQEVIVGDTNETNTIIEAGLKAGEEIYLSTPANINNFNIKRLDVKENIATL